MIWLALLASPSFVSKMGADKLRELEAAYWQKWTTSPPSERDPVFVAVDHDGVGDGRRDDDSAVKATRLGALVLKADAKDDAGVVKRWRFGIGVLPRMRGKGVGHALIVHAMSVAGARGANELGLLVDPKNDVAIALYKKLGFVDVGERDGVTEMRIALARSRVSREGWRQ
jgi:GNAT superfamily N-acetyltransferase